MYERLMVSMEDMCINQDQGKDREWAWKVEEGQKGWGSNDSVW